MVGLTLHRPPSHYTIYAKQPRQPQQDFTEHNTKYIIWYTVLKHSLQSPRRQHQHCKIKVQNSTSLNDLDFPNFTEFEIMSRGSLVFHKISYQTVDF